jgi:hypothetical protein
LLRQSGTSIILTVRIRGASLFLSQLVARILIPIILVVLQTGGLFQAGLNPIQIHHNRASVNFPDVITFQVDTSANAPIQLASLRYGTNGRTCTPDTYHQNLIFTPGTELALSWSWNLSEENLYLPPGAQVWWQWLIHTQDEHSLLTERQIVTIEDHHHDWKTLDGEGIHLEWFEGDLDFGQSMLERANQSLTRLTLETGLQIEEPVRMVVYPDAASIQSATPNLPEWTGGVAFPEFNTILAAIPPHQLEWGNLVIPHEIAHLVLAARVFNCHGASLPIWFIEGFSKFAEEPLNEGQRSALLQGLENGELPALQDLDDRFPYEAGPASQAYLVSLAAVNFLLEAGGSQSFARLLDRSQAGEPFDQALLEVYGYRVNSLDQAWQAGLGFGQQPAHPEASPSHAEDQSRQGISPESGRDSESDFPLLPEFGWEIKPGSVILGLLILTTVTVLLWWRSHLLKK